MTTLDKFLIIFNTVFVLESVYKEKYDKAIFFLLIVGGLIWLS